MAAHPGDGGSCRDAVATSIPRDRRTLTAVAGQEVLVDQGGEVTAVKRGTVPGALGLPPLDTWLYTVEPEAGGEPQTDVPEYNVVTCASLGWPLS